MQATGMDRVQERIQDIMSRFAPQHNPAEAVGPRQQQNIRQDTQSTLPPGDQTDPSPSAARRPSSGQNSQFGQWLDREVDTVSRKHGVSRDLIEAVMQAESGGRVDALSPRGARGLMQLMPGTAEYLGVNPDDPRQNLDGGVRYLRELAGKFDSLDEVLAAYNAGPGKVQKYGGVPPYRETQNYVSRIKNYLKTAEEQQSSTENASDSRSGQNLSLYAR